MDPKLYGITKSNRTATALWGKNQFNSSFPVALACYMRDHDIKPLYLTVDKNLKVKASQISVDDLFNTKIRNEDLHFAFESKYEPYAQYAYDDIGNIDLVVKHGDKFLRPLEIKLTVLPDETTHRLPERQWGSELVIRPDSAIYAALGIVDSCKSEMKKIRDIIEPVCHDIRTWGNAYEIRAKMSQMLNALNTFQKEFHARQQPFLMEPIWKTEGKNPVLAENAFDIFVWSDFALCRLFLDLSAGEGDKINRLMRSSARFARFLYEVSTRGKTNIKSIDTEMAHDLQTDKEFALSGRVTRAYVPDDRILKPALKRTVLKEIILNGGEKKLSPERRFDQTIYYTAAHLFEELGQSE